MSTTKSEQPDDYPRNIRAIKAGIAEARKLFAENPDQFDGELSDDDLVAFIHTNLYHDAPKREVRQGDSTRAGYASGFDEGAEFMRRKHARRAGGVIHNALKLAHTELYFDNKDGKRDYVIEELNQALSQFKREGN